MDIYEGRVFRPPSEARSLIIQATIGCSHNKCKFCTMYIEKNFRLKSVSEIIDDLEKIKNISYNYERIFLADGDALSLPTKDLLEILKYLKNEFSHIRRIGIYAHGKNLLNKGTAELKLLKEAGLKMIYLGLESGSDEVLEYMNKGIDVADIIKGHNMAIEAGLKTSVMLISGLGGKEKTLKHAIESANAVNQMQPTFLSFLTLMLDSKAEITKEIESKRFELLDPNEVLLEAKEFIVHTKLEKTIFRSNHASNYLSLSGVLGKDKEALINEIEGAIKASDYKDEIYRGL